TIRPLLPLSLACAGAYLGRALARLLDWPGLYRWRELVGRPAAFRFGALALTVLLIALVQAQLRHLFTRPGEVLTAAEFGKRVLVTSVAKPLVFLVAHVVWYGPLVLVTAFL